MEAVATIEPDLEMLTQDELAEILKVNPRMIRGMVKRGDIPNPIEVGRGEIRFSREIIRRWLIGRPLPTVGPNS